MGKGKLKSYDREGWAKIGKIRERREAFRERLRVIKNSGWKRKVVLKPRFKMHVEGYTSSKHNVVQE